MNLSLENPAVWRNATLAAYLLARANLETGAGDAATEKQLLARIAFMLSPSGVQVTLTGCPASIRALRALYDAVLAPRRIAQRRKALEKSASASGKKCDNDLPGHRETAVKL